MLFCLTVCMLPAYGDGPDENGVYWDKNDDGKVEEVVVTGYPIKPYQPEDFAFVCEPSANNEYGVGDATYEAIQSIKEIMFSGGDCDPDASGSICYEDTYPTAETKEKGGVCTTGDGAHGIWEWMPNPYSAPYGYGAGSGYLICLEDTDGDGIANKYDDCPFHVGAPEHCMNDLPDCDPVVNYTLGLVGIGGGLTAQGLKALATGKVISGTVVIGGATVTAAGVVSATAGVVVLAGLTYCLISELEN